MKLVHPLPADLRIKPNRAPSKPKQLKDFREAYGALIREVKIGRKLVSNVTLHTDAQFSANGSVIHRPENATTAAVLEFRHGNKKIWVIANKYGRTADNIYQLSQSFCNWRKIVDSGVTWRREKMVPKQG